MNIPNRFPAPGNSGHSSKIRIVLAGCCILWLSTGCGTNLEELVFQSVSGLGRTVIDQWLTDFANDLAEQSDQNSTADEADADGNGADDTAADDGAADDNAGDGDVGDDVGDEGDDGGATDPLEAPAVFANTCAACHGADGASGFAPNIRGKTADELLAGFSMPSHVPVDVTDEDAAAISEFLSQ